MKPTGSPLLKPKGRLASHKHRRSTLPMLKHCQRTHAANTHSARESARLDTFEHNPTTSTSATPALGPTTKTTKTTYNNFIDALPPTITILPPLRRSRQRTPFAPLPPPPTTSNLKHHHHPQYQR
ncbi:unnamed protein product [Schistocephalus solidus]|uniref:Uncharacterized protein n=1 Tax=Schistocephalus solidus TaxID=70667 RepID=A0A183SH79_SCHSO|nr:unnamed protein product [Schistocephalus solidus]